MRSHYSTEVDESAGHMSLPSASSQNPHTCTSAKDLSSATQHTGKRLQHLALHKAPIEYQCGQPIALKLMTPLCHCPAPHTATRPPRIQAGDIPSHTLICSIQNPVSSSLRCQSRNRYDDSQELSQIFDHEAVYLSPYSTMHAYEPLCTLIFV